VGVSVFIPQEETLIFVYDSRSGEVIRREGGCPSLVRRLREGEEGTPRGAEVRSNLKEKRERKSCRAVLDRVLVGKGTGSFKGGVLAAPGRSYSQKKECSGVGK